MSAPPGPNLLCLLGPTACGKTALGVRLARCLEAEIVSADSRQVYRELDIGAGKEREAYRSGGPQVRCHLIDLVGLDREFSLFDYQRQAYLVIGELFRRQVLPLLVGGSGMYLEAVLLGYRLAEVPPDPALRQQLEQLDDGALYDRLRRAKPRLHATTDLESRERMVRAIEIAERSPGGRLPERPDLRPLVLGLMPATRELRRRIEERLRLRLEQGLIEEVQGLLASGVPPERLEALGLEYRYLTRFLRGQIQSREDLFLRLAAAIVDFAKRQRSWFRRMERRGVKIHWLEGDVELEAARLAREAFPGRWKAVT